MPEEPEIETKELQETLDELQEERREREEEQLQSSWTRYVALSTALLAVFAAIAALQSGALVNEAMIKQLKASDTWAEYQSSRVKTHIYTVASNGLLDNGAAPPTKKAESGSPKPPAGEGATPAGAHGAGAAKIGAHAAKPEHAAKEKKKPEAKALPPSDRLRQYLGQVDKEDSKQEKLREDATHLEEESEHLMHRHHQFAWAVAFIQVSIALSAVAALTKIKPVWFLSLLVGAAGVVYFVMGLLAH